MYVSPQHGAQAYAMTGLSTAVSEASPHRLIQMLYEGLLQRLTLARIAVEKGDVALRGSAISKALTIVGGLHEALDMERGGELAQHLDALYQHITLALFELNTQPDLERLSHIQQLVQEIKEAWDQMPQAESMAR